MDEEETTIISLERKDARQLDREITADEVMLVVKELKMTRPLDWMEYQMSSTRMGVG